MEHTSTDDEESEEGNLDKKTGDNDILSESNLGLALCGREEAATSTLGEERDHVAADKDFGQPFDSDERELVMAGGGDGATQDHVDRGGEECWCDKEQE